MKFCKHCGFPIPEGSRFCPGCGVRLSDDDLQKAPRSEDVLAFDPSQNRDIELELTEVREPDLQPLDSSASEPSESKTESDASSSPYWLPTQTDVMKKEQAQAPEMPQPPEDEPALQPAKEQDQAQEEERADELEERGIRGMITRYKSMPEDLDEDEEDDEDVYYEDAGGFRGGFLIGAGLCTALLVCLGLAFLNGWIRLPSKIEDEPQSEVASNTQDQTVEQEPEEETVEDSADSFKKAFEKNNTTVPSEEDTDKNSQKDDKTSDEDLWVPYGSMNVRARPDASSRKTGTIPAGEPVKVLETVTGPGGAIWGRIGSNKYICLQDGDTHFLVPSRDYTPVQNEDEDDEDDQRTQQGSDHSSSSSSRQEEDTTRKPSRNDD